MDITARKRRLDEAADLAQRDRVGWHGELGDACPRCEVRVPAGFLLTLPDTDVTGCLRCLEKQAYLAYAKIDQVPHDLAGVGPQQDAQRIIAQEFRQHIKAAERGRMPPSRREAASRWAAQSGWETTEAWEPPLSRKTADRNPDRWPKKPMRAKSHSQRSASSAPSPATPPSLRPAQILGLTGNPGRAEIIAAFRRCALVCHPDYGGSEEEFRALVKARDALLGD